jgi:hypothetical protein
MSATNALETATAAFVFNDTSDATWTALGAATELYVSLYTSDPGEAGTQPTNEAAYDGYLRQSVDRDSGGWTCSTNSATNVAQISFPQCTGGTIANITHVGVGLASSGAGILLGSLELDDPIVMSVGATPIFSASQLTFTFD